MVPTIEEPYFELDVDKPLPRAGDWEVGVRLKSDKNLLYRMPMKFKQGQAPPLYENRYSYQYQSAMDFLLGPHDIDDNNDAKWIPWNLLGQGGYGKVGLWRKCDEKGAVVDQIAIKQQLLEKHHLEEEHGAVGLHPEAIIQLGLQQKERAGLHNDHSNRSMVVDGDRHIVHLRQYKFSPNLDFCRMYLDYCPHGTVADLAKDYRVFSKRLPIPFLWHLFHSLALATQVMDGPFLDDAFLYKWRKHRREPRWDNAEHWTLHLDIKDLNVLLGEPDSDVRDKASANEGTRDWPSVKIADFGVSMYTSSADKRNPPLIIGKGTHDCMPPEQRRWKEDFRDLPNFVGQQWTSTHMVWQVAKVVWDCAFHWKRPKIRGEMDAVDEETYEKNGNHWIAFEDMPSMRDERLAKLLHRCLDPIADNRPKPKDLVELTRHGLKESLKKEPDTKLFFRGREIKNVDPGSQDFVPVTDDYIAVRFRDPENLIDIPGEKWSNMEKKALDQIRRWAEATELEREVYVDPWPRHEQDGKQGRWRKGKKQKTPHEGRRKPNAKRKKRKKRARTEYEKLMAAADPDKWYQSGEESDPHRAHDEDEVEEENEQQVVGENQGIRDDNLVMEDNVGAGIHNEEVVDLGDGPGEQSSRGTKRKSDELEAADSQEDRGGDGEGGVPGRPEGGTGASSPDPSTEDYAKRTNKQLLADIKRREITLPKEAKKVKATYVRALRDADQSGNKDKGARAVQRAKGSAVASNAKKGATDSAGRRRRDLRSGSKKAGWA